MADLFGRLLERGLVTQEQGHAALLEAAKTNRTVWFALVKLDYLSEESIVRFLAQEANVPYIHISDYRIKQGVVKILDEHFCRQNAVIPLWRVRETLFVACSNPFNMALLDSIGKLCDCSIELLVSSSTEIIQALDYYWRIDTIGFDMANFIVSSAPVKGFTLWRRSERIGIDWPVSITLQDDALALTFESRIESRVRDISRDGSSIGVDLPIYLPKGITVAMAMHPIVAGKRVDPGLEAEGEIVQSYMNKTPDYLVGIRFKNMQQDIKERLLTCADIQT